MNWFIIIFFIIAIILFLITKYYLLKQKLTFENIESFENEAVLTPTEKLFKYHNIKLQYLDTIEAEKLINKNGEYLKGMNQANLSARGCSSIDELYEKYKNAFDTITQNEKDTIDLFILKLMKDVKNHNTHYYKYIQKWFQTISIAKAKKWLESGMPHTLDTTIIMDADWFIKPRKTTLIHEITHIHQRKYPIEFEDLYPLLGYYYNPVDIKGLEVIYPLNRNNPDGMDKYWLWHNIENGNNSNNSKSNSKNTIEYWWIGAIFKTAIPINLNDVNLMALKLDRDQDGLFYYLKQNPTALSKLTDFIKFFGENPNNYHPNEMTAKFSEWFLIDILKDVKTDETIYEHSKYEGYNIYKKYFENLINKYY